MSCLFSLKPESNSFLGLSAGGGGALCLPRLEVSLKAGRSRSQKFPRAVGRWCSLAKVASLAIPSSPAGAAKARKEEQQWSAKAVISLPSPRSRLLLLLSRSLRMRCSTPDPGGNVRHAPAPLLFRPPVGIRTVTWPHTSAPPPAPNQSTKVLANPRCFLCTHFPATPPAPPRDPSLNSRPVLLSRQTWWQNDVN